MLGRPSDRLDRILPWVLKQPFDHAALLIRR